jgi:hypothetical protein
LLGDRGRAASRQYDVVRQKYLPRIVETVRDPENQRRALEAVSVLTEAREQFQSGKHETAYSVMKLAGRIRVNTPSGRVSLEEAARQRMLAKHPYLRGTPLTDDPAAPLAHLFTGDFRYFVDEMPLVESWGRRVSLRDAMLEPSPFDSDRTRKYLAVLEAVADVEYALDTGKGGAEASWSVLRAIEAVNEKK